ncbi:hypothetical protein GCM10027347_52570 [Larkinella harenae]
MIRIDLIVDPENPLLELRQQNFTQELAESAQPPVLEHKHPGNALDAMRSGYRKNRVAMELEGLTVNDTTSTYDYWSYYDALEQKCKNNRNEGRT